MRSSTLISSLGLAALTVAAPVTSQVNQIITAENIYYTCSSGGCLWSLNAEAPDQGTGFPAINTTCEGTRYDRNYVPCENITPTETGVTAQNLSAWIEIRNNPDYNPYTRNTYIPPPLLHLKYEVSVQDGGSYNNQPSNL